MLGTPQLPLSPTRRKSHSWRGNLRRVRMASLGMEEKPRVSRIRLGLITTRRCPGFDPCTLLARLVSVSHLRCYLSTRLRELSGQSLKLCWQDLSSPHIDRAVSHLRVPAPLPAAPNPETTVPSPAALPPNAHETSGSLPTQTTSVPMCHSGGIPHSPRGVEHTDILWQVPCELRLLPTKQQRQQKDAYVSHWPLGVILLLMSFLRHWKNVAVMIIRRALLGRC